jgi:hypothetical protein
MTDRRPHAWITVRILRCKRGEALDECDEKNPNESGAVFHGLFVDSVTLRDWLHLKKPPDS